MGGDRKLDKLEKMGSLRCPQDTQAEVPNHLLDIRHLEVKEEVGAGKRILGSVSKEMALKVTEQDELNHRNDDPCISKVTEREEIVPISLPLSSHFQQPPRLCAGGSR